MDLQFTEFNYNGTPIPAAYTENMPGAKDVAPLFAAARESGALLLFAPVMNDGCRAAGFEPLFKLSVRRLNRAAYPAGVVTLEKAAAADISALDSMYKSVMVFRNHITRSEADWNRIFEKNTVLTLWEPQKIVGYAACAARGGELLIRELFAEDEDSYKATCAGALDAFSRDGATLFSFACPHDRDVYGAVRILDIQEMLRICVKGREDSYSIVVDDEYAIWNSGRYVISGGCVGFEEGAGGVSISPANVAAVLLNVGAMPYVNLLD